MAAISRLSVVLSVLLISMLAGCTDTGEINRQDSIIASNFTSAKALLAFQEQAMLTATGPSYQSYSDAIGAACAKLDEIDGGKTSRSAEAKAVCENKKGLDNCFFQVEKIRLQLKNNDTKINIDSLDVLCSDLRSMGLQTNLETFKSQYTVYAGWVAGEAEISSEWASLSILMWNSSLDVQPGAKLSDYYRSYQAQMSTAKASLQAIKSRCALKNDFKATDSGIEKICNNVDDYLSDIDKANSVGLDTLAFFSEFEVGTVTINALFIKDCYQASKDFAGLYDLELMKDTQPAGYNETDLSAECGSLAEMSDLYGSLGIPLILENGGLSPTTTMSLSKAKTVYVETNSALGSGVIIDSDEDGYYILTSAHLAMDYDPYTGDLYLPGYARVKFYDGKTGYATQVAYTKEAYDLAILYVPSSGSYPVASYYADYYPSVGDKVFAVGNPYGLEFSTSQGTVSGIRDIGCLSDYCYGAVIQTDTAINPGNSGGGLWDYSSGDLLGINSLGLSEAEGINLAISMYQYEQIKDTFKWYVI